MLVGGIDAPQQWFGEALNLALALRSAVPSEGGVVIAGSTHALLGSFFDCEQLHPITLDDGHGSVPAWCVVGESTAIAGRFGWPAARPCESAGKSSSASRSNRPARLLS
jgi:class 3 adenylate cyclase